MNEMNQRLKVCHFASVHTTTDTRVFHRECVSLAKEHDVTLIAIGTESGMFNGVNVIAIPKPTNRFERIFKTTRTVYQMALEQDADVYHFHDPELIPFALKLKRKGKQVIYDIHENVTEGMKIKRWLPFKFLFIQLYLIFDLIAARNFELILAEKAYVPVYKKRYPHKETNLVENFAPINVMLPYQNPRRSETGKDLFYMGSFDEMYCFEQMLEATYKLIQRGWLGKLYIIGHVNPEIVAQMRRLPYFKKLSKRIEFKGYLSIREGYEFSKNCAAGYCFVSNNVNVRDSLPRKLYEYMCIGLPIICSNFPTYDILVNSLQIGICVDSGDVEDISNKTLELLHNKKKLDHYSANGIKAATDIYNWEKEERLLLTLYQNLFVQI